jgi:uncharacterized protein with GYD domain
MPRYVALIDWTDQGVRSFKETLDRADMTDQIAESLGAKVVDLYWTLGAHDIVAILEAPDDETATAFLLSLGGRGNVRTKTLRAFNRNEMRSVVAKTA